MSWSRRGTLAGLGLAVAGCGFEPVYGRRDEAGDLAENLRAIALPDARSAIGYTFRQELEDQLNPTGLAAPTRYRLAYQLELTVEDLAVQLDAVVTRRDLNLATTFTLLSVDDVVLMRGRARRSASYNIRQIPYNDLIAQEDAERRAAAELAVAIRQQIVAHFQRSSAA